MNISDKGLDLIKRSEGFRSRVYTDVAGFATIGFGHKLTEHESYPNGLTEAQADVILRWDVHDAEQGVMRLVKVPLTQGQFDALVDFTFNLGAGRLASSTLLKLLNLGRYDEAGTELLKWDRAGGRELPALTARRRAEYQLWAAGLGRLEL